MLQPNFDQIVIIRQSIDEYLAYGNLKKYGFVHEQVCHSQKEYAREVCKQL
jgi:hypothetical protein